MGRAQWKTLVVGDRLLGVWGPIRSDSDPLHLVVAIFEDLGETFYVLRTLRHSSDVELRRLNHEVVNGWAIGTVDDGNHRFRRTKVRK